LTVGADVQAWIDADFNRLATNEVWAMSGGTAMWGVCCSIYIEDPVSGQTWLPQALSYMDTYAGPGEWNNSWNVWYAHAYHAAAAVLVNPTYTGLAYALVDTLLDADTDNDGGIMATSTDPPTEDQSWVSCYLDYMGMEYLIDELPARDSGALVFLGPDTSVPIAQGEEYSVSVVVGNTGLETFGNETVRISGPFTASLSTYLDFADVDTLDFGLWIPLEPGMTELVMSLEDGGELAENDTLILPVNVLGWGDVIGSVVDAVTNDPIAADLEFYLDGASPEVPTFTAQTEPNTGEYQVTIMEGTYRVIIDPELPYTDRETSDIVVQREQTTTLDFSLYPAPTLLVDDDGGEAFDQWFYESLIGLEFDVYDWHNDQSGTIDETITLFDAVIWMTGNESNEVLTACEIERLEDYLSAGGSLLMSGQNIAESLAGNPFLADYLGVSFESAFSGQLTVQGLEGDPVTAGLSLMFPGSGGAGNQTSPDAITATAQGVLSMVYPAAAQPGAAVIIDTDYKSLYLAFGLEGVSGAGGTNTREDFLEALMSWFEIPPMGVPENPSATIPGSHAFLELYPNPFNPDVEIKFELMSPDRPEIMIFNLQGQLVTSLSPGFLPPGRHSISHRFADLKSSGVYYFMVEGKNFKSIACGIFMK
jgi:hypothetical protein